MERSTVSCFSSLIYLENFFCINRSYLITDRRTRIFGNIISILIFSIITIVFADDMITYGINDEKKFQGVLVAEFLVLAILARYSKVSFAALKMMDDKCSVDEEYIDRLKRKVNRETIVGLFSITIDIGGLYYLGTKTINIVTYVIVFAAHETETILFALIIEGINLRLCKLYQMSTSMGSRVYRHALIASSLMNVEFTPRILFLLSSILYTTISYSCIMVLMFSEMGVNVAVYLLWREIKSMYSIWRLCKVAFESETICQQLGFQLAKKFSFDPAFFKDKNPQAHSIMKRWYTSVLYQRPRYVRGSIFSIGLAVPLHLMNISINYMLIVIQIDAYK